MKIRTALVPVGIALALTTGSFAGTALAAVPYVTGGLGRPGPLLNSMFYLNTLPE